MMTSSHNYFLAHEAITDQLILEQRLEFPLSPSAFTEERTLGTPPRGENDEANNDDQVSLLPIIVSPERPSRISQRSIGSRPLSILSSSDHSRRQRSPRKRVRWSLPSPSFDRWSSLLDNVYEKDKSKRLSCSPRNANPPARS